jgi:hypothetical protein
MCLEDSSGFITQIGDGGQFVVNYSKKNSSLACASFFMQNLDLMRTKFSGILGVRLNIFLSSLNLHVLILKVVTFQAVSVE